MNELNTVVKSFVSGAWIFNSATTSNFWRYDQPTVGSSPQFNDFAQYAAVFDQYKVNAIKVTYRCAFDNVPSNTTVDQLYVHCVIDAATQLVPGGTYTSTNLRLLMQEGGKTHKIVADRPFSVYFKPKIEIPSSVGTGSYFRRAPWLLTDDTNVPLRGYHMFLYANNFGVPPYTLDAEYTWYMSFKNRR